MSDSAEQECSQKEEDTKNCVEKEEQERESESGDQDDAEIYAQKEELGLTEVESLCMNCMENGMTRFMIHKIPYFRELVIASFECEHCGERNNEVTFGGEIQVQGCVYQLEVTNERDLNRQIIKSDSATVTFPSLEFEIPAKTQKGEISTIEGFISTAARNLGLYQRERMEQNPEAGARVAEIIVELGRMAAGLTFPFLVVVDDCAGNSFVENPMAPHPDPHMHLRHYNRTPEQDLSLGLQPEHGTYRDDADSNLKGLIGGEFGGQKLKSTEEAQAAQAIRAAGIALDGDGEHVQLGRQEIIRIPEHCPSCGAVGESLTALTDIPHFKEVIIMAYTCGECGYKNSEVKGGGAVPTNGSQVTLHATTPEDLKRDVLKSDSAMVRIRELDMELGYGTLGGVYTTVEGLLTKIEESLRDSNPFMLGDSSTLHHSEEMLADKPKDRFTEVLQSLKDLYLGNGFPFTLDLKDPLGNSFISAHIGSFIPPEADPGLTISDYERSWEENEEFGLNDMNTRDFETGVEYDDGEIFSDRKTHVIPKGMDHPTPFAQGVQDSTPSGMYFTQQPSAAALPSAPSSTSAAGGGGKHGWVSVGPSWGPEGLASDLGVIAPPAPSSADVDAAEKCDEEEYFHPRRFDEADLTIQFKPREEFGKARPGFVFRMGAQGLGYYEDIRGKQRQQQMSSVEKSDAGSAGATS